MDWELLRTIGVAVFGLTTLVAAAIVGLLVGTTRTLRDSNADLRLRVTDLEQERAKDKANLAASTSENSLLKTMITGKVEWVALTDQLEEHHRQAVQWWRKTEKVLDKIAASLEGNR